MGLPVVKTPVYTLTLPSKQKKLEFRPFVTKEEKILLMAKESGKEDEMMSAVKSVVKACTFDQIDVGTSPLFDIEYIFVQLRARSIGEKSILKFKCTKDIPILELDDNDLGGDPSDKGKTRECGGEVVLDINFLDIEVVIPEGHTRKIIVDEKEGIGITLNYPCVEMADELKKLSQIDFDKQAVVLCESIFDADNVYPANESSKEELTTFFEGLMRPVYVKIKEEFFDKMPSVQLKVKYKCPDCGHEDVYTFKGIKDFF